MRYGLRLTKPVATCLMRKTQHAGTIPSVACHQLRETLEPRDLGDHLGGWVQQQVSAAADNGAATLKSRTAKPAAADLSAVIDLVGQPKAPARVTRRTAEHCEQFLSHNLPPDSIMPN